MDLEKITFWVVCAIVGYLLGRFRMFRADTKEEIEWLWDRVRRLERRVDDLREEVRR